MFIPCHVSGWGYKLIASVLVRLSMWEMTLVTAQISIKVKVIHQRSPLVQSILTWHLTPKVKNIDKGACYGRKSQHFSVFIKPQTNGGAFLSLYRFCGLLVLLLIVKISDFTLLYCRSNTLAQNFANTLWHCATRYDIAQFTWTLRNISRYCTIFKKQLFLEIHSLKFTVY